MDSVKWINLSSRGETRLPGHASNMWKKAAVIYSMLVLLKKWSVIIYTKHRMLDLTQGIISCPKREFTNSK